MRGVSCFLLACVRGCLRERAWCRSRSSTMQQNQSISLTIGISRASSLRRHTDGTCAHTTWYCQPTAAYTTTLDRHAPTRAARRRYSHLRQPCTYICPVNYTTGPPSAPEKSFFPHTFSFPVFVPPSHPASVPPSILPFLFLAWRPSPPDAAPPSARTRSSQKYPSCRSCAFTDHAH